MPIHDWTGVDAGTYHDFHQGWTIALRNRLNAGILPEGYFAMADQRVQGPEPDVVTLRQGNPAPKGGRAVAEWPPGLGLAARVASEAARYARKADRIAIKQGLGRVVAIVEIVSPGNKDTRHAAASFAAKLVDFVRDGIHVLWVDPFPPGPRDPDGLAQAVWDGLVGEPLPDRPPGRPLCVAAIDAGEALSAYVDWLTVGDPLPDAPLFLGPGWYVNVPLEETYRASWDVTPRPIRDLVAPSKDE